MGHTDSDGTGNNADTDDDNDGYSDAVETAAGTSTIDASDIPTVDLSDSVDAQIGEASGLDTIEANLSLWLDASNIDAASNATLSDGDAIGEWKDLTGNNKSVIQATESKKPIVNNDMLNGKSVVRFDGSNDHLTYNELTNWPVDDISIFIVQKASVIQYSSILSIEEDLFSLLHYMKFHKVDLILIFHGLI